MRIESFESLKCTEKFRRLAHEVMIWVLVQVRAGFIALLAGVPGVARVNKVSIS